MIGVWPLPTAVPLVHQNPRDVQQLEEHGNSVVVTGLVQSCAVEVVFVVVYMFYYCNHQAGPLVTSTPGVGVSSSKKKFPQLLHLAKIALLPQVVLLGRHGFVGDSLQNKQQGIQTQADRLWQLIPCFLGKYKTDSLKFYKPRNEITHRCRKYSGNKL